MTETADTSARLVALETVVRHLLTHLAVRSDDPAGWVQTRKVLALHAVHKEADARTGEVPDSRSLEEAVHSFFDQAEAVATDYSRPQ